MIRYYLIVTAIVAISLAVVQTPFPAAEGNFTFRHFLALWPIRFLAFVGSVTLTLHTISLALRLGVIAKWLFAVLVPTAITAVWDWYAFEVMGESPGSLGVDTRIQIALFANALSFACLTVILATGSWVIQNVRRSRKLHLDARHK